MPLHKQLFAYALSLLKNESDASDCLQEALTRLWEKRGQLDKVDNPEAYATVTVRNVAITFLARRRRMTDNQPESPPDASDLDPDPLERIFLKEKLEVVNKIIKTLPDNQRKVVMLSSLSGLSNNEIKQVTGLSDDNVRVILSRGRRKIKELLGKFFKEE